MAHGTGRRKGGIASCGPIRVELAWQMIRNQGGRFAAVSVEHKKFVADIARRDTCPEDEDMFGVWRTGLGHVDMLRRNAAENPELMVAVSGPVTFVHAAVVEGDHPGLSDQEGLLKWSTNPFFQRASTINSFVRGGTVRTEPSEHDWGTVSLAGGWPLVYGRDWEGMPGPEGMYYEIAQPYIHHLDAHWTPSRNTYCRFDRLGDWEDVVCITQDHRGEGVNLISFLRDPLDQYLVEHNAVLVQLFEFMFRRPGRMPNWRGSTYSHHGMNHGMAFFQQFSKDGSISKVQGVQIVRPRLSVAQVAQRIAHWGQPDPEPKPPVEFTVLDIRTGGTATVSTDPATTTSYFDAADNSLPYETSPAFFRSEVLAKYQADSEKYTVEENRITCRGGWDLRDYSVNDAGQVVAYICRLRDLPYEEQLYWASCNEPPKAGLSERAITTDFLGEWPTTMTSREKLVVVLRRWSDLAISWWKWRPDRSPDRLVVVPRTESRDGWGRSLVDLSNGVIEGFVPKELRSILAAEGGEADPNWKSIVLLENILRSRGVLDMESKLEALRDLNAGRNLSGVHVRGSKAREYVETVKQQHGTYAAHYEHLCENLTLELALVEKTLAQT